TRFPVRDLAWNTETNEIRMVGVTDWPTVYTDDLSLRATMAYDEAADEQVLEVTRLADKNVLLRKAFKGRDISGAVFSPDGRRLMPTVGAPPRRPLQQPLPKQRTVLWKVGGRAEPLWEREDERPGMFRGGPRGFSALRAVFSADGKTYTDYLY